MPRGFFLCDFFLSKSEFSKEKGKERKEMWRGGPFFSRLVRRKFELENFQRNHNLQQLAPQKELVGFRKQILCVGEQQRCSFSRMPLFSSSSSSSRGGPLLPLWRDTERAHCHLSSSSPSQSWLKTFFGGQKESEEENARKQEGVDEEKREEERKEEEKEKIEIEEKETVVGLDEKVENTFEEKIEQEIEIKTNFEEQEQHIQEQDIQEQDIQEQDIQEQEIQEQEIQEQEIEEQINLEEGDGFEEEEEDLDSESEAYFQKCLEKVQQERAKMKKLPPPTLSQFEASNFRFHKRSYMLFVFFFFVFCFF